MVQSQTFFHLLGISQLLPVSDLVWKLETIDHPLSCSISVDYTRFLPRQIFQFLTYSTNLYSGRSWAFLGIFEYILTNSLSPLSISDIPISILFHKYSIQCNQYQYQSQLTKLFQSKSSSSHNIITNIDDHIRDIFS